MSDTYLHLIKVASFTCLMIVPFLFAGWIAHRILDRPWRVSRSMKVKWWLARKLKGASDMVRKPRKRSGLWLLILMTWDLLWRR